ncbi:hypothetical protein [Campylobacter majalis]|uniref:hypothetical protein n=1 Tax=Campylobacter majalis TaxID=2790656 RepID=UPI003D69BF80
MTKWANFLYFNPRLRQHDRELVADFTQNLQKSSEKIAFCIAFYKLSSHYLQQTFI